MHSIAGATAKICVADNKSPEPSHGLRDMNCRKHSMVIDLLSAGAFSHPDYTVGVGIPGSAQSPHSCLATLVVALLAGLPI
jgi:hypothetical protein